MSTSETTRQLVIFSLGAEEYALPITRVQEIIRYTEPRSVASQTAWIRGVINLRGKIVPVCDLALRLGLPTERAESAKIVIVETQIGTAGVIVDDVEEVLTVSDEQLEAFPAPTPTTSRRSRRSATGSRSCSIPTACSRASRSQQPESTHNRAPAAPTGGGAALHTMAHPSPSPARPLRDRDRRRLWFHAQDAGRRPGEPGLRGRCLGLQRGRGAGRLHRAAPGRADARPGDARASTGSASCAHCATRSSPIPVVVVSAFSPAHGARAVDALAEGAVELVAKPSVGQQPRPTSSASLATRCGLPPPRAGRRGWQPPRRPLRAFRSRPRRPVLRPAYVSGGRS